MGKHESANLNDRVRNHLEATLGDGYEVFVEGEGMKMSPTRVVVTDRHGHKHEFHTTISEKDFYKMVHDGVCKD